MAKITRRVLTLLESLYRFTGGQKGAPDSVELDLGVQPVHDLSRMAEIGAAKIVRASAGYWMASVTHTHVAGIATIDSTLNLVSPFHTASEGYSFIERDSWAWYIADWCTVTSVANSFIVQTQLNNITNDFFVGPSVGPPNSVIGVINRYTSFDNNALHEVGLSNTRRTTPLPLPILSPQDGILVSSRNQAGGITTINVNIMLWIGQRNTFPPGLS